MTKVIGLTGGIASGKSTVSKMLAQVGLPIIDADLIVHRLQQPGQPGFAKIVDQFGPTILTPAGELDRARLGRLVFNDDQLRAQLNEVMQPLVRTVIMDQVAHFKKIGVAAVVLDLPLLFEQHYDDDCDLVVVVAVNRQTQLARLEQRNGYTKEVAQERIDAQMPLTEKVARADIVINNNGDRKQLQAQVAQLVQRLTKA